ncbi:rCG38917, isoform CRA_a, partial [Rattus norvegicus]
MKTEFQGFCLELHPPGAPAWLPLHPALSQPVTTWAVHGVSWKLEPRLLRLLSRPFVLDEQKT